jgi:thioredoxin-dependent peroxiredoxin
MLKAGDVAPDIELRDQSGTIVRLSDLLKTGPVVLFFYPAAMSAGCTAESCHFRDLGAEFAQLGAQRLGISTDSVERQKQFAERHGFDYPLLSDEDGAVAESYGVRRRIGPIPVRRATFVIGADGVIIDVVKSELRMDKHADDALDVLREHTPKEA